MSPSESPNLEVVLGTPTQLLRLRFEVQARKDRSLVQGVGTDLGDVFKVELAGFGDCFNVGRKKQESIKNIYKFLNLTVSG